MPYADTSDGVKLYYEETGTGQPLLFVHEFAGGTESWETQVRFFSRYFRCITFNARGYPPSEVPAPEFYSQRRAACDIGDVMTAAGIEKAHIVGCSMGAFALLHFITLYAERCLSATLCGIGYGSEPDKLAEFRQESAMAADLFRTQGMQVVSQTYAVGPARVQLQNKDRRGWAEFAAQLANHSTEGAVATMRGLQMKRPSIYEMEDLIRSIKIPTLVVVGDEDEPALEPSLALKRYIRSAGLVVLPKTGHAVNLEEPAKFNDIVFEFVSAVTLNAWHERDLRSLRRSAFGVADNMPLTNESPIL